METRTNTNVREADLLLELVRHQQEEVARYKWIESEKAGHDIGWERATAEWLEKHFPAWERHQANRAIDDALHATAPPRRRRGLGRARREFGA
jgi:hypothetical protein